MAFSDPLVISYNGANVNLSRVSTGQLTSTYQSADGGLTVTPAHTKGKRWRRSIRMDHTKIITNPYQSTLNNEVGMKVSLSIDTPLYGYSAAEAKLVVDALLARLTATSGALVTQLLQNEN